MGAGGGIVLDARQENLVYSNQLGLRIVVPLERLQAIVHDSIHENREQQSQMADMMRKGTHIQLATVAHSMADTDGNSVITWNNGEVRAFVHAAFAEMHLQPPQDKELQEVFCSFFDPEGYAVCDRFQGVCMVDALCRAFFCSPPGSLGQHSS